MKHQVGWFNLRQDREYTTANENKNIKEKILVKAGTYPAEVLDYQEIIRDEGLVVDGRLKAVYVNMPGTVTSLHGAGSKTQHTMITYMFAVAESILKDPHSPWDLLPEYEAKAISNQSETSGKEIMSYAIYKKRGTVRSFQR